MSIFRNFSKYILQTCKYNCVLQPGCINTCVIRLFNQSASIYGADPDPAPIFFNTEVQTLLKSLTRINLKRVYKKRKLGGKTLEQPVYKFMTDEQLNEVITAANSKVDEVLQMPPAVAVRKPIDKVLIRDPALQGLFTTKYVFTDVTFGMKDKDRLIVIREPDGTLREADWEVRDRINQIYFPKVARAIKPPLTFQEEYLSDLLVRREYEFVLDLACAQFEPNNPEYQRITSVIYENINKNDQFDLLRSTRHFGSLVFYLVWFKNIENLLLELIETAHIEDANSLLNLYGKIHNVDFAKAKGDSLEAIVQYIGEIAHKKAPLELALQAYKDLEKERRELERGIQVAHGLV